MPVAFFHKHCIALKKKKRNVIIQSAACLHVCLSVRLSVYPPAHPTGKYMQMMSILKPIAFDVIHCVSQLFDYYLYAVYTFFGRNDMVRQL